MARSASGSGPHPIVWWIPAICVAVGIFVLSSIPGTSFPRVHFVLADKVAHAVIFGVLAVAVAVPIRRMKMSWTWMRVVIAATVLAGAYGLSDELHQLLTPHRSSELLDVVADTIGGLLGAAGYATYRYVRSAARAAAKRV